MAAPIEAAGLQHRWASSVRALVAAASLLLPAGSAHAGPRVVFLVPVPASESWQDQAFLSAVPAACRVNGDPIVLCVDPVEPWRPELLGFLNRYAPSRVFWIGETAPTKAPIRTEVETIACDSGERAACKLASKFFETSRTVVLYDPRDRSTALSAAVLAARIDAPLFPCSNGTLSRPVRECVSGLGAKRAVVVGLAKAPKLAGLSTKRLADAEAAVRWLSDHRHPVEYLAVTNPNDVTLGPAIKLSLAAVLLAAGRHGALVPLAYATQWKRRHAANAVLSQPPRGVVRSNAPVRGGTLAVEQHEAAFVTGRDPKGRWFVQIDRNGDGDFGDKSEQPVGTGGTLAFAGSQFTVDLDVDEHARGHALWLTSPTPTEMRSDLSRYREAARGNAEYVCLVGWPDTLPMAVVGSAHPIDSDLVSDVPLAQTDADPFVELATARFIADDCASGTLLACRSLAYDDFPDRSWQGKFATAEWEGLTRPALEHLGLTFAGYHPGKTPITSESPLTHVNLIEHGAHASWCDLGKTYAWNSNTPLAPCLVDSSGCSTAALDQDPGHRSVVARMLRNGAVAFAGNSRRCIAEASLFRSELLNALSRGLTLGRANRAALNRVIVATLEKGQTDSGNYHYQLMSHAVFGDPALDLAFPRVEKPARVVLHGSTATVYPPDDWTQLEYGPLAEWGCRSKQLYTFRAAGMGLESSWNGTEKRNADALYFTAEVRTRRRVKSIREIDEPPAGLGWTGRFFIDEHADGSRSIYWRTRLIDFDMTTGAIRARSEKQRFRLSSRARH